MSKPCPTVKSKSNSQDINLLFIYPIAIEMGIEYVMKWSFWPFARSGLAAEIVHGGIAL
jgi:hypothetical protein